mgnify:CR=1 FL=1
MKGLLIICTVFLLGLRPIEITSSHMDMNMKERKMEFVGDVIARQGDVTITCDKLTAYYGKDKQEVKRIVAQGGVRITQKERVAVSDRAEYDNVQRSLRLTGKPRVWQGSDVIEGEEILVFLAEGRVKVKKAQATYLPGK